MPASGKPARLSGAAIERHFLDGGGNHALAAFGHRLLELPVARGEAQQILNQAEGYKQERINDATGAVARFIAIQKEYAINPSVTRTRLYLEAIKILLPDVKQVYIMQDNGDVLKFLPMTGSVADAVPTTAAN